MKIVPRGERSGPGWLRVVRFAMVIYLSPVILLVIAFGLSLVILEKVIHLAARIGRFLVPPDHLAVDLTPRPPSPWGDRRFHGLESSRRLHGLRRD